MTYASVSEGPDISNIRATHRSVIEDYMSRCGESRLTRYQLFHPDGVGGLWTNDTLAPIVSRGHENLKAHGAWSLKCFPDWQWTNIQIFETHDPDRWWVECDGEGQILFPGYPPGRYENHFIHSFLMSQGKIKEQREFMNPYRQMVALGIPIPQIRREGIPAD
jgi:phenazine biosynthesis protein